MLNNNKKYKFFFLQFQLNMLMRLQEAANYPENADQESDCASLDSNITPDSSAAGE